MATQKRPTVDRRPRAVREAEQRQSRRRLAMIIVTAIVVPICVTCFFVGSERAQGIAAIVLAVWLVAIAFIAMFQKPVPRSRSSWTQPGDGPPGAGTSGLG
jgi:hypothetical protein